MITLREMLPLFKAGSIEVLNEINEPLLRLANITECVLPVDKAINPSLLDREVLASWGEGEDTVIIKVTGEDDAE